MMKQESSKFMEQLNKNCSFFKKYNKEIMQYFTSNKINVEELQQRPIGYNVDHIVFYEKENKKTNEWNETPLEIYLYVCFKDGKLKFLNQKECKKEFIQ